MKWGKDFPAANLEHLSRAIRKVAEEEGYRVDGTSPFMLLAEFDEKKVYLECVVDGHGFEIKRHRFLAPEQFKGKRVSLQWVLEFMRSRRQLLRERLERQADRRKEENERIIEANAESMPLEDVIDRTEIDVMMGYPGQSALSRPLGRRSSVTTAAGSSDGSWGDDWQQEDWEASFSGPRVEDGVWHNDGWVDVGAPDE